MILGTVSNMREAVEWLGYTYLYIRCVRGVLVRACARVWARVCARADGVCACAADQWVREGV